MRRLLGSCWYPQSRNSPDTAPADGTILLTPEGCNCARLARRPYSLMLTAPHVPCRFGISVAKAIDRSREASSAIVGHKKTYGASGLARIPDASPEQPPLRR